VCAQARHLASLWRGLDSLVVSGVRYSEAASEAERAVREFRRNVRKPADAALSVMVLVPRGESRRLVEWEQEVRSMLPLDDVRVLQADLPAGRRFLAVVGLTPARAECGEAGEAEGEWPI